jgi:hypothetical protein
MAKPLFFKNAHVLPQQAVVKAALAENYIERVEEHWLETY